MQCLCQIPANMKYQLTASWLQPNKLVSNAYVIKQGSNFSPALRSPCMAYVADGFSIFITIFQQHAVRTWLRQPTHAHKLLYYFLGKYTSVLCCTLLLCRTECTLLDRQFTLSDLCEMFCATSTSYNVTMCHKDRYCALRKIEMMKNE